MPKENQYQSIMKQIFRLTLAALLISAMAVALPSCGNKAKDASCPSVEFSKKLPVGVQLYSVRTDMEADMFGTLKKIREMVRRTRPQISISQVSSSMVSITDIPLPKSSAGAPSSVLSRSPTMFLSTR